MHEPYKSNDISYKNTFGMKKGAAKQNQNIPGSECMNGLVIRRSDIRTRPKGLAYWTY